MINNNKKNTINECNDLVKWARISGLKFTHTNYSPVASPYSVYILPSAHDEF